MKEIIGHRDPQINEQEGKQNEFLRVLFGHNRLDNAFFLSETVGEAIEECDKLFKEEENEADMSQIDSNQGLTSSLMQQLKAR